MLCLGQIRCSLLFMLFLVTRSVEVLFCAHSRLHIVPVLLGFKLLKKESSYFLYDRKIQ